MVELPFRDVLDVILKYHNDHAYEMIIGDMSQITIERMRSNSAMEIIDCLRDRIERQGDREELDAEIQRKYEAFRGTLYFTNKRGYREVGE